MTTGETKRVNQLWQRTEAAKTTTKDNPSPRKAFLSLPGPRLTQSPAAIPFKSLLEVREMADTCPAFQVCGIRSSRALWVAKMPSKYSFFFHTLKLVLPSPLAREACFLQQVTVNIEIQNWSKCWEQTAVEYSSLNGASITTPRPGTLWKRGWETGRAGGQEESCKTLFLGMTKPT